MPPFMPRSSTFWIITVLLGVTSGMASADQPPCPSSLLLSGGTAPRSDSLFAKPAVPAATAARKAEDEPIDVSSDDASIGADGRGTLSGNVDVRQGDRHIQANEMQYDREHESVQSNGHIDYQDSLVHVTGSSGKYSATTGGSFTSAQFLLTQRGARGTAQEMRLTPQGVLDLTKVTFTNCPVGDNSWELRASEITLDTKNKIGTGHGAKIEFMGVPIIYLPWISFPLSNDRKSGFLFPSIGNTSSGGFQFSAPYYWNIAPNLDFTFEPTEYTRRGIDLGGDLRFLTANQHGELDWNFLPRDSNFCTQNSEGVETCGDSRNRVRLFDVAELPYNWLLTVNAENVSDTQYFEDFSKGPEGASTAFLERSALFSYRDEHWRIDAQAEQHQTIDIQDVQLYERPYARVPRIVVDSDWSYGENLVLRYGFDSEVVNFRRSIDVQDSDGWRMDLMPRATVDMTGPGYFVRPGLAWRLTQYELDDLGPGFTERSPSRTLPIASFDTGLIFEKDTGSRDQRKLTLEPRLLYLWVPYRNQDALPVFDTALPDLNPIQLFRLNRYVGADRVSDANQLSIGVTSRLLDAGNGRQFLAVTLGQTYYFQTPRVTLPTETPATGDSSDFVAQISLTAYDDWSAEVAEQWDPQQQTSERTSLNLQYKPAPDKVINVGYRFERFQFVPGQFGQPGYEEGFDQVEFSGTWPIKGHINIFAREVVSLRDNTELERFAGFEYRACCWRMRLGARRFVSSHDGSQDTGIWLQLELAGLAGVGSASDGFLTEEIRGYMPAEAPNSRIQAPLKSVW
jgi:LPS-assembly protein